MNGRDVRLAHFSDVHLTLTRPGWSWGDLLSKRVTGWVNLKLLGRGSRFGLAGEVVPHLMADLRSRPFDHWVFTGDATMMAFESETALAAGALGVGTPGDPPAVAVPGNHDAYTYGAVRNRAFERYFAPWQEGERVDGHAYPFARRLGDVWLVAVNTARPRLASWDASGRAGPLQRKRLAHLLERLPAGPRVVVTHYPLVTERDRPEPYVRRLRDWRDLLAVARAGGVALWLNGHRHRGYHLPPTAERPFPLICVGSATQRDRWSYNDVRITDDAISVTRRTFDLGQKAYLDSAAFELPLGGTVAA